MPSSLLRLRMDFFGLRQQKTLDASTLSADLALNFLPLDGFSNFLLRLFYSSIDLKVTIPQEYLGFSRISVEIKLPAKACLNSLIGFSLYISRDAKNFFF